MLGCGRLRVCSVKAMYMYTKLCVVIAYVVDMCVSCVIESGG